VSGLAARQPLELRAGRDLKLQRLHGLRIVPLQDSKQRGDIARDIIDDLAPRSPAAPKEYTAHAHERLGVGFVTGRLDLARKQLPEPSLAADIGRGRPNGRYRPHVLIHQEWCSTISQALLPQSGGRRAGAEQLDVGRALVDAGTRGLERVNATTPVTKKARRKRRASVGRSITAMRTSPYTHRPEKDV
jgi:hypothetical protein